MLWPKRVQNLFINMMNIHHCPGFVRGPCGGPSHHCQSCDHWTMMQLIPGCLESTSPSLPGCHRGIPVAGMGKWVCHCVQMLKPGPVHMNYGTPVRGKWNWLATVLRPCCWRGRVWGCDAQWHQPANPGGCHWHFLRKGGGGGGGAVGTAGCGTVWCNQLDPQGCSACHSRRVLDDCLFLRSRFLQRQLPLAGMVSKSMSILIRWATRRCASATRLSWSSSSCCWAFLGCTGCTGWSWPG